MGRFRIANFELTKPANEQGESENWRNGEATKRLGVWAQRAMRTEPRIETLDEGDVAALVALVSPGQRAGERGNEGISNCEFRIAN